MNNIKFKVYDKIRNAVHSVVYCVDFFRKEVHVEMEHGEFEILDFEDAILLQYTGLKDKNGIEIYEGDIVKFDYNEVMNIIGVVDYDKYNHSVVKCVKSDYEPFIHKLFHIKNAIVNEVIGNIFENKDLIGTEPKEM